ncbi:hypothetical protein BC939DRAFT_24200 [Gamsiella multidivaricata]|uniref:uncharacterized protein n=1 Tax=Gamsiella multidivaricata TaxID=101098 RepID=UPI002220B437|nr:uncharacterized protein BC939DRAFT_24200 [Gamsiella multidivaricata]KAI7829360.1 hypothetical protein BC939DRAFT_24200 [Gamsiella multidivaricata]
MRRGRSGMSYEGRGVRGEGKKRSVRDKERASLCCFCVLEQVLGAEVGSYIFFFFFAAEAHAHFASIEGKQRKDIPQPKNTHSLDPGNRIASCHSLPFKGKDPASPSTGYPAYPILRCPVLSYPICTLTTRVSTPFSPISVIHTHRHLSTLYVYSEHRLSFPFWALPPLLPSAALMAHSLFQFFLSGARFPSGNRPTGNGKIFVFLRAGHNEVVVLSFCSSWVSAEQLSRLHTMF